MLGRGGGRIATGINIYKEILGITEGKTLPLLSLHVSFIILSLQQRVRDHRSSSIPMIDLVPYLLALTSPFVRGSPHARHSMSMTMKQMRYESEEVSLWISLFTQAE